MRIVPTAELYSPTERAVRHDIEKPEDSYAPFPTRADFKQAEIFVNYNSSDKLFNEQPTKVCVLEWPVPQGEDRMEGARLVSPWVVSASRAGLPTIT